MLFKDKKINILCWLAIIILNIGAITNNDLNISILAYQLLTIMLLISIKYERK